MLRHSLKLILAGAVAMPVFLAPDLASAGGKHHNKGGHHYKGGYYKGGHYGGYGYKSHHYKKRYGYGYGYGYGRHYKKPYYYKPRYNYGGYYYGGHHGHHKNGNAAAYAGLAILGAALGYAIHESNKNDNNQYQGGYAQPNTGYAPQQGPRVVVIPENGQYSQGGAVPQTVPQGGFDFSQCRETREYQTTILVEGQEQLAYGTACLMPDGNWVAGPMQIGR